MSTQASKRLRLSLAVLAMTAVVYLVVTAGLQLVVARAESSGQVYPYKDEDWLRYLLPTFWRADKRPLMLLTGPSTVGENLLFEEFAAAFPEYRILSAGINGGTLGDAMAGLDYVERVHGPQASPRVLVLGLSARFVADLPRTGRWFAHGLEHYSPYYRVPSGGPVGFGLARKSALDGALARARFLLRKQQPRYAATSAWLIAQAFDPYFSERLRETPFMQSGWARLFLPGRARQIGIHNYALERASPYKYRNMTTNILVPTTLAERLESPYSVWRQVFAWDPAKDSQVRARIAALLAYAKLHDIDVYAVNLPEGSASRVRYHDGYADRYLALLDSAFATAPLLNLRCLLNDDDFHDSEHARFRGAKRTSAEVIDFVRTAKAPRTRTNESLGAKKIRRVVGLCADPPPKRSSTAQPVSVPSAVRRDVQ